MQSTLEIEPATLTLSSQLLRGGSSHRRMSNNTRDASSYPKDWLIFTTSVGAWVVVALIIKLCCMKFLGDKIKPYSEREFDVAISEAESKTQQKPQRQKSYPTTSSIGISTNERERYLRQSSSSMTVTFCLHTLMTIPKHVLLASLDWRCTTLEPATQYLGCVPIQAAPRFTMDLSPILETHGGSHTLMRMMVWGFYQQEGSILEQIALVALGETIEEIEAST